MRLTHTGAAAALTAVAISIPCGAWYWLGSRQLRREAGQLELAASREASFAARQLAARLALRLDDLRDEEAARPAGHYWARYLAPGEGCAHPRMRDSPLAERKRRHPVIAHFQIDQAGRITGPRTDRVFQPSDLVVLEEEPSAAGTVVMTARAAPAAVAGDLLTPSDPPRAEEAGKVGPFRWQTARWQGRSTLVALREVEVGGARFTQGFALDNGCLSHWMYDGGFPSRLVAGRSRRETEAPLPLGTAAWHVSVDARPAIRAARAQGAALRRQFHQSYFGGLLGATLAGTCVVALVRRSGKLARDRTRFAAAAAHELRTPLAGIRLHGEMLAHSLGNPSRVQEYAQRITDEAERLGRLVSNVLAHSQVDRKRLQLRSEPGDLGAAVREGLALFEPMVAAAGGQLDVQAEAGLPPVSFDRDAVHQIVRNLVDNADKYSRGAADRRIEVEVKRAGAGGVAVEVRDHGPGVAPAGVPDLFRPFSRPAHGVPPVDGLGLGLSVVRSLALAHRASVAHRPTPGGGATFTVTFPVV